MSIRVGSGLLAVCLSWTLASAGPTAEQKCLATKFHATAVRLASELKCNLKAVAAGVPVDNVCMQNALQKFVAQFVKADREGACAGDVIQVALTDYACLGSLTGSLSATTTTTLPVCCNGSVDFFGGGSPIHVTDGCFMDVNTTLCNAIGPPTPQCVAVSGGQACISGSVGSGLCDGATGFCAPAISGTGSCCQRTNPSGSMTCLEGTNNALNQSACTTAGGVFSVGTRCLATPGSPGNTTCQ